MKVCVVGSGGREHALALALARTAEVVVTPGNPGMELFLDDPERQGASGIGTITITDAPPEAVAADLVVIGPEQPLVDGLADHLRGLGRLVFGPGADGARLEGSKTYMKEMLAKARVPTARWGSFDDLDDAIEFLKSLPGPWVVKTDGLAAGKGVLVTDSIEDARADVAAKLSGTSFGSAGQRVVVEEGLIGRECSLLVLCDGKRIAALAPAQDAKRVGDDDTGPNTGGMGAFSPVAAADAKLVDRVLDESVEPLVGTMRRSGIDYRGVLYAGLMLTEDGPKVLEYNVRFGDPETQVVLPRLDEDLTGLLAEAASGRLRTERAYRPRCGGVRGDGVGGLPRHAPHRRRRRGPGRRVQGTGRHRRPRRHRLGRRRQRRHGRRAGARCHRRRRRPGRSPRARLRRRRHGLVAGDAPPQRHRGRGDVVIPRYSMPEMAALFTDEARLEQWLEVELLAVEGFAADRRGPHRRCHRGAVARSEGHPRAGGGGRRPREADRSRRGRLRRRRTGGRRATRGIVDPLRTHFFRCGRHRLVLDVDPGRRPAAGGIGLPGGGARRRGPSSTSTRPWPVAPTECTPSPPPSGRSCRCGASRPTGTALGCAPRAAPSRWASCRARSGRTRTSIPGSRRMCAGPSV